MARWEAFASASTGGRLTPFRGARAWSAAGRGGAAARRGADAFDPFGWKGALKDTVQGLMDGLGDEEAPSKVEEEMILEIFRKFDVDADGFLNLEEFNKLQVATEGEEAVYNQEQLKALLLAVNPSLAKPEQGMPFADYRRLYVERRLRRMYGTDVRRDHVKIFGAGGGMAEQAAAAAEAAAALSDGAAVRVEGLASAVELNGRTGHIVAPVEAESPMVAEGRVIVKLDDNGERVALRPVNVRALAATSQTVD